MAIEAVYNSPDPAKADVMQLFHVFSRNTKEEIKKLILGAPNPNYKLIVCTAFPGEDKLMQNLRELGFVEMGPEILRVTSYYSGTKVKLFILRQGALKA